MSSPIKPLSDQQITALLARLEEMDDFVLLETSRPSAANHQTLLFTEPREWLACAATDNGDDFLQKAEQVRERGHYLAGRLGYEFGYLLEPALHDLLAADNKSAGAQDEPLALLGVFDRPYIYDHATGSFADNRPWPDSSRVMRENHLVRDPRPNVEHREYLENIQHIKNHISAGDTYQVNYTIKLDFLFSGSPASFYLALRKNQSVSHGAWIRHAGRDIMSFSPELFFRATPDRITVRPMKGTMKRGRTPEEDEQLKAMLANDEKNISENVMIVDLLRNDLGRVLHSIGGGRVEPSSLFDVETYETLLQMTSSINGIPARPQRIPLKNLLRPLFPCGSVTGAPKIRAMQIIHELEKEARGVYCGAIGYSGPAVTEFNVPIRTLTIKDDQGAMGIGSGIVHDSDPEGEWRECLLKAKFLENQAAEFQLIETLLLQPAQGYWLLEYHLERLARSARYFLFTCNEQEAREALRREQDAWSPTDRPCRVRLLLHRDGSLETSATGLDRDALPPVEPTTPKIITPAPKVVFSTIRTDPGDAHLFHKTTQRRLYNAERLKCTEQGYYEVLFTNTRGEVTEGSITNIFIEKNGEILTPPISCGLLAGTFRRLMLERDGAREQVLSAHDVLTADAVYVGNSVRGLVRVAFTDSDD